MKMRYAIVAITILAGAMTAAAADARPYHHHWHPHHPMHRHWHHR